MAYIQTTPVHFLDLHNNPVKWPDAGDFIYGIEVDDDKLYKMDSAGVVTPLVGGNSIKEVLTKTDMLDRIINNDLEPGAFYLITGCNSNLYRGTDIMIQAVARDTLANEGQGIFWNPKYEAYSIWNSSITHTVGTKAIWGGKVWINVNGNLGSIISDFTLSTDWTIIVPSYTDYNFVIDKVIYDITKDTILGREDVYGNKVKDTDSFTWQGTAPNIVVGAIAKFQFGGVNVKSNEVEDSWCNNLNSRCSEFVNNKVLQSSTFTSTLNSGFTGGIISRNKITRDSEVSLTIDSASVFTDNEIDANSFLNVSLTNSLFELNTLHDSHDATPSFTLPAPIIGVGAPNAPSIRTLVSTITAADSKILGNTVREDGIFNAILTSNSLLTRNTIINSVLDIKCIDSNVENNQLSGFSALTNRDADLFSSAEVSDNILTNASYIYNNHLDNGNISGNILSGSSYIVENIINNSYPNIKSNSLSKICQNIISAASFIWSNTFTNNGSDGGCMQNNTVTGTSGFYIATIYSSDSTHNIRLLYGHSLVNW